MPRGAAPYALLTLLALAARVAAVGHNVVISRDGIAYLAFAEGLRAGAWDAALRAHYPPGYPALLAALAPALGLDARGAGLASALAGALLAPAAALLARPLGRLAARFAGLLAALLPVLVELGAEPLSDGLHLTLCAWTLVALAWLHEGRGRPWAAALAAAGLGGAAYLTRPEALLVLAAGAAGLLLLPRPAAVAGARRRLADAGRLVLPGAAAVVPYLAAIRAHAVLGGVAGAGAFKLTLKQDLPALLAAASPAGLVRNGLELGRHAAAHLAPAALALLGLRGGLGTGAPGGALRRHLGRTLLTAAALAAAFAVVRPDRRFAAQLAALALPLAGLLLARLARDLSGRLPARARPRAALWVGLLLLLPCLPLALRDRHRAHATWRDAGLTLRALGSRRVVAGDSRAAFYAGAEDVGVVALGERREDGDALVDLALARGADALVVRADGPARAAVARRLGPPAREVRAPRAEPLDVFLVRAGVTTPGSGR